MPTRTIHLSHNVWHPSAEEEEGNDATELEGACTSHYKSSYSCMNNSTYVSRSLSINNPQHVCYQQKFEKVFKWPWCFTSEITRSLKYAAKRAGSWHTKCTSMLWSQQPNQTCPWSKCWVNLKRALWQAFATGCLMVFLLNQYWISTNAGELLDLCTLSISFILAQLKLSDPIATQIPLYFITLNFCSLEKD